MKKNGLFALAGLIVWACTSSSSAAVLDVQGGVLMGATGVNVNGTLLDVRFRDGSCSSLFGGCDEPSDFFLPDRFAGMAANAALLDQVFRDSPAGQFDTIPGLTNGCGGATMNFVCYVLSPLADPFPATYGTFISSGVRNRNLEYLDTFNYYGGGVSDADYSLRDNLTFAVWSGPVLAPSGPFPEPLPEPTTALLFGLGLLGLITVGRKKSSSGPGLRHSDSMAFLPASVK